MTFVLIRAAKVALYKRQRSSSYKISSRLKLQESRMIFVNIVFYFMLPALAAGYFFLKRKYSYFKDRDIPHITPPSLLMGNIGDVGKKYHMVDFFKKLYNECKGQGVVAGYYASFVPTLMVTDLELAKQITVKDFNSFSDRGFYINEEVEPITGNLLQVTGEKWRFLRNKLSPAFTSGKIKMMYHTISDKGVNFVKALEKTSKDGASLHIKNITTRFTVDVISSCAFGLEANTLASENPEMVDILKSINGEGGLTQFRFFFTSFFPKLSKFLKMGMFGSKVNDFFENMVGTSIRNREDNNVTRNDFLNILIQLKNKSSLEGEKETESRKLTMNECVAQAFIFFLGGADTSSTTISYAILELGLNPDIQDKLRKEIREKTKSTNGEITYENLHEMTYLAQVVNGKKNWHSKKNRLFKFCFPETLRMHVAGAIIRQALVDYKIKNSNIIIEKGTQVWIPNRAFHYDEKYWKNPESFEPERFLAEENANRPSLAFMPFGNGPRNCIGMRFGLVNSMFGVATIIKNFKVTTDTMKLSLPIRFDPKSMGGDPVGGPWVKLEKL